MHFHGFVRTMYLDFKYFVVMIWCYRLFIFVAGVGGPVDVGWANLVLCPVTMYSFKSENQRQPTMFKCAEVKNNEAVLVIK